MDKPYSAAQFSRLINPTMARVYIEVHDIFKGRVIPGDMLWDDPRVIAAFCKLMGVTRERFNSLANYPASQGAQVEFILRAREANAALWQADEVEQLDGQPALDFALGWMHGLDWVHGLSTCHLPDGAQCEKGMMCPPDTAIEAAAMDSAQRAFPAVVENYLSGFRVIAARRVGIPGGCALHPITLSF